MAGAKRFWAGVLLVVVLAGGLAGCSTGSDSTVGGGEPTLPPGTVEVTAGADASTGIEGLVTIEIPGDSIEGRGQLSVTEAEAKVEPGSDLLVAEASAVEVEVTDASLVGPATITFDVGQPPTLPEGLDPTPVMVVWDREAERWVEQPALYDAESGSLIAQTDHFSVWSWLWPSERIVSLVRDALDAVLGGGATRPACESEDAARGDGWSVTSDDGDRIMWCFGIKEDRRIVRVANNRPYPVVLTYNGDAFTLAQGPENDVSVYSLYRSLLEAAGRDTTTPQVALPAGAALAVQTTDPEPRDGTWGIKTEWDGLAMAAEGIDLLWQTLLATAGGSATAGAAETFVEAVSQSDCIRSAIVGDSGLNAADTIGESLQATYNFLRTCGPDLVAIAADTGSQANPLLGVIGWFTNTVISAIRQLLGDAYAIYDIATSPAGDARYLISLNQVMQDPATPPPSVGTVAPGNVAVEFVRLYVAGRPVDHLVNPEAWGASETHMISGEYNPNQLDVWLQADFDWDLRWGDTASVWPDTPACADVGDRSVACAVQFDSPPGVLSGGQLVLVLMTNDTYKVGAVEVVAG